MTSNHEIDPQGAAGEESLERRSWEEWFRAFDERDLGFLHRDEQSGGDGGAFFKLVDRDCD